MPTPNALRIWLDNYDTTSVTKNSVNLHKKHIEITERVETIADLLKIATNYPMSDDVTYNIDMERVQRIYSPLCKLNMMIGMNDIKRDITDQILYYIQGLHKNGDGDFMHTVLYGPPGTGKTEVAKLIGDIFVKLGVLGTGVFRKVGRADLVAGYLGQTAMKTRSVVESALGGVLFIDEAYALGDSEHRDSFAKECLDTLCDCLSEYKNQLIVVIAGYKAQLDICFFGYNEGLSSRFPWRYETGDYTYTELREIFMKKVTDSKWSFHGESSLPDDYFKKRMELFKNYGRDMETLFSKAKIAHAHRVFGKSPDVRTQLTLEDVENGIAYFLNKEVAEEPNFMYI
jgi:Cdc6-like AAA superfamily ATPase